LARYIFDYSGTRPIHPVQFFNEKTRKTVKVDNVLSDTGAETTWLNPSIAPSLGVTTAFQQLYIKIGNLKPFLTPVHFAKSAASEHLIGRDFLNNFKVIYQPNRVIYEELTFQTRATSAYANIPAWYKGRI